MTLTAQQLELRRAGIGGSEIAAVVGLDPYKTALDVWLAKPPHNYFTPTTPPMERGIFLEPGVANWYAHRTGATLTEPGTLVSPKRPLALCTPDRFATIEKRRLLSIKVPGPYVREEWGEEWTEEVPLSYLVQLQWEDLVCSDYGIELDDVMELAAPVDGDLRIYKLRRDRDLQQQLYERGAEWWEKHVVRGEQPPIDGSDSSAAWLKRRFPRDTAPILSAGLEHEVMALKLKEAEESRDRAEMAFETEKNRLKEVIGEAAGIEGSFGKVTWRADKNGKRSFKPKWRRPQ